MFYVPSRHILGWFDDAEIRKIDGISEQKRRLEAEGIAVVNGKVDLKQYGYGDIQ